MTTALLVWRKWKGYKFLPFMDCLNFPFPPAKLGSIVPLLRPCSCRVPSSLAQAVLQCIGSVNINVDYSFLNSKVNKYKTLSMSSCLQKAKWGERYLPFCRWIACSKAVLSDWFKGSSGREAGGPRAVVLREMVNRDCNECTEPGAASAIILASKNWCSGSRD